MSQLAEEILVKLDVPVSEETIRLSTLDQQAQRNYANLLLLFELGETRRVSDVVEHLKRGLGVALSEIPDFASTVVALLGSCKKELELRLGPDSGVPLRVVNHRDISTLPDFQDHQRTYCNYAELAADSFPTTALPPDLLFFPRPSCEETGKQGIPALLVQINLVEGGIILAISWHHSVSDARAVNRLAGSWAHHTKASITGGDPGPPAVPSEQTRERWRLEYGTRKSNINLFPDYTIDPAARSPLSQTSGHLLDRQDWVDVLPTATTWYFSATSLKSLRSTLAESGLEEDESAAQFTQSEAVSALIWKHLSRARQLDQGATPGATSLFTTRVDYRGRANPPLDDDFVGNINEPNARSRVLLDEVCSEPTPRSLAVLAREIRTAIAALDEKAMRDFIGLVNLLPAVTDLTWSYNTYPGPDLGVTDLSGLDTQHFDWGGPIGLPACVRSGSREKGLAYILPQDRDGGIEVQLQCESEAAERLKADEAFTQYALFRC
jgi:hypothetical protein